MILDETQKDRDIELSELLNLPIEAVERLEICAPASIRLYPETLRPPGSAAEMVEIYKIYKWLDFKAYLRTLMFTSVERRHPELLELLRKVKGKKCLDFGSGVGTHAIALCENENDVTLLDVPGPLSLFAERRIARRGHRVSFCDTQEPLPKKMFDVVICSDVLEHTYDPVSELQRILDSLKPGGILHIVVSKMVKISSGHFPRSIQNWVRFGQSLLSSRCERISTTIYKYTGKRSCHPSCRTSNT